MKRILKTLTCRRMARYALPPAGGVAVAGLLHLASNVSWTLPAVTGPEALLGFISMLVGPIGLLFARQQALAAKAEHDVQEERQRLLEAEQRRCLGDGGE